MGTIKSGILGGFSGKVGGVVGTSWKGIAVMKAIPQSVANPRTNLQIAQRTKMQNIVAFAGVINASIIKPLKDRFSQQMSGYNAFVQDNIALFENAVPSQPFMLKLATGKMIATEISLLTFNAIQNSLTVRWSSAVVDAYQQATDAAYVVVQNSGTGVISFSAAEAVRSAGEVTLPINGFNGAPDALYCWLAFRRSDGTIVSDTSYSAQLLA